MFTSFLGYIRERQCSMKGMSCSGIEDIEKQVKNWRPSDARVQLEQLLVMKEVRTVSAEQLAAYQQHFAPQARGVQAMNGRTVVQSP
jgi:hypothetical protein